MAINPTVWLMDSTENRVIRKFKRRRFFHFPFENPFPIRGRVWFNTHRLLYGAQIVEGSRQRWHSPGSTKLNLVGIREKTSCTCSIQSIKSVRHDSGPNKMEPLVGSLPEDGLTGRWASSLADGLGDAVSGHYYTWVHTWVHIIGAW